MKGFKKVLPVVLAIVLCVGIIGALPAGNAEAATKMSRLQFIVETVMAMEGQENSAGKELTYTFNSDGSVTYADKTVAAPKVGEIRKKYGCTLKNAQYLAIAADMKLFKTSGAYYKSAEAIAKKANYRGAVSVLVKADEYLHGVTVDADTLKLAKSRISNLKKAGNKTNQKLFAKAFALGLYAGNKEGKYSTTRSIKPNTTPSKTTCEKLIARLVDAKKRIQLTDDLQVIRTTKLPKTADLYPYILDSYPNAYYDTAWIGYGAYYAGTDPSDSKNVPYLVYREMPFEEKLQDVMAQYLPYEMKDFYNAGDNECVIPSKYRVFEEDYPVLDDAIEFYTYALNVDYRTIKDDKKWYSVMSKYLSKDYLDDYIETCIKNKTIVECDIVAGDKSSLYMTDTARFKVYLHFRVISDRVIEGGVNTRVDELVPVLTQVSNSSRTGLIYYMNYQLGDWVDYYVSPGIGAGCKLGWCDLKSDLMVNHYGLYPWLIDAGD